MRKIQKVAILGASGNMGSHSGAVFAGADIQCIFFARSMEKAKQGIESAMNAVRSSIIKDFIIPRTYDDLEKEIPECDWVFEALAEDIKIKREFFGRINGVRKPGTIVSSVSSGLSILDMVEETSEDFKAHALGTHFYNPPTKLSANELIFHPENSEEFKQFIKEFCEKTLHRINVETYDTPGFAGNRIGFQLLNSAAVEVEKSGAAKTEYLLGPYTGRAMAPLATIDLVGLDVHKAITDNLKENTDDFLNNSFSMPDYMNKMIEQGMLGNKTPDKGGFFRGEQDPPMILNPKTLKHEANSAEHVDFVEQVKDLIHNGIYRRAVATLFSAQGDDAGMVRRFILNYISYSFSLIGIATPEEDGIHGIDKVMAHGFSWMPPSGWIDLIGGPGQTMKHLDHAGIPVPDQLKALPEEKICRVPDISKYLVGR